MPALKKSNLPHVFNWTLSYSVVLLSIGMLTAVHVSATGITIENSSTYLQGDIYLLNADIQFELSEEAVNALQHGIALHIHTILRLKEERDWLWDPIVRETVLRFRLEHQPLSDHYIVTDLLTGIRHTYQTLYGAVGFFSKLNNIPFFEANLLKDSISYTGHMRTHLDIESLPAPLRPIAYLSSHWRLSSPWYTWAISL